MKMHKNGQSKLRSLTNNQYKVIKSAQKGYLNHKRITSIITKKDHSYFTKKFKKTQRPPNNGKNFLISPSSNNEYKIKSIPKQTCRGYSVSSSVGKS